MLTWICRRLLVSFAAVCVLLLFFFPLVQGPFQATHGPTTEFGARKAFLILLFSILHAATGILCRLRAMPFAFSQRWQGEGGDLPSLFTAEAAAILRC